MRRFSSASTSASAGVSIPTRHSRHLPRPVCADAAELEATTASLLASRPGSLFTYEHGGGGAIGSLGGSSNKADEYEAGLARSDVSTQKFEWTLGGHAAAIPGTVASAAAAAAAASGDASSAASSASLSSLSKNKKHLDAMVELLERIEEEGRIYVELRARVLNQQFGSGGVSSASSSSSDSSSDSGSSSSSDSDNETSTGAAKSQSAWRIQSLINRYGAAPGPSIYMYDALLDAIACCAEQQQQQQQQEQDDSSADMSMEYLALARSVYERAMARHYADGGPNANNRLTVPTLVTYNAVLRTCAAAVEHNNNNNNNDNALRDRVQVRDAALDLAFVVYDALNANSPTDPASTSNAVSKNKSSKKVAGNNTSITTTTSTCTTSSAAILPKRNSATYAHMLRVIARCIPPSPTRGNVAYGLWLSCTGHDGVLDGQVIQAFVEANTRNGSNGQQYDAFVAKVRGAGAGAGAGAGTGAGIDSPQENDVLRQNWWRNRNSRRIQQSSGGSGEGMSEY